MTRQTCLSAFYLLSQIFNLLSHFYRNGVTQIENAGNTIYAVPYFNNLLYFNLLMKF